jgi:hypothetical protein
MQDNYGLVAEFSSADALLEAAKKTKQEGYKNVDAYSPFPIHGLGDVLGFSGHKVAMLMLLGGIIGGLSGLLLQYWVSAIDYPINIGGRPLAGVLGSFDYECGRMVLQFGFEKRYRLI